MEFKDEIIELVENGEYEKVIELYEENSRIFDKDCDLLFYYGICIEYTSDQYIEQNGAYEIYERAAEDGSDLAAHRIASYHFHEFIDYREDDDLEIFLDTIESSAKEGFAPSKYVLGEINFDGEYVLEDLKCAFALFEEAAISGYIPAFYRLAYFYLNGEIVEADVDLAMQMYITACDAEFEPALIKMAYEYIYGNNIEVDYSKAFEYLNILMEVNQYKGDAPRRICFKYDAESFIHTIPVISDDIYSGIERYYLSDYLLGYLYEKGLGVEKNIEEAMNLYTTAGYRLYIAKYRHLIIMTNMDNYDFNKAKELFIDLINDADLFYDRDEMTDNERKLNFESGVISLEFINKVKDKLDLSSEIAKENFEEILKISSINN